MKKKRLISLIIIGCALITLISVGFASWVISRDASTTSQGNISVDTVVDNKITLTTSWTDSKSTIKFAPIATTGITNPWLATTGDSTESLSVTLNVTVDKFDILDSATYTLSVAEANKTNYDSAVSKNYITSPTGYGSAQTLTFTKASSGDSGTATLTLTWGWGSAFESKNPTTFFNSKTKTDKPTGSTSTYEDLAQSELSELNTLLKDVSFVVTISAKSKATA